MTVAQLREKLATLDDATEVVVACEHDSYIRFAHTVGEEYGFAAITDHGHSFAVLYGDYGQVSDDYPNVGSFNEDDEE